MRQTNVEFLTDLMEFGNPLKQAFIMDAIGKFAHKIAKDFDPDEAEASGNWGLISPHAWKVVAIEIHEALEARTKG